MSRIDPKALAAGIAIAIVTVGLVGLALHYGSAEQRDALVGAIVAVGVLAAGALRSWLSARQGPRPLTEALRDAGRDVSGRDSLADELDEDETPALGRRAQRPPPRRGGWSGLDAAIAIAGLGLGAAVLAAALSGCGASELDHHATAAVVMGRVHGIAEGAVDGAIHAAVTACYEAHRVDPEIEAAREACVAAVRAEYGPGKTALAALRAALSLYRESIQLAVAAHGGDVMAALQDALRGVLEDAWPAALAALAGVGVELPPQVSAWVEVARSALLALLGGATSGGAAS